MAGVYIGRLNPIHRGHQRVINKMLEEHEEDHLLLVGSSTAPFSLRNYFSYAERSQFIRARYIRTSVWLAYRTTRMTMIAGSRPSMTSFALRATSRSTVSTTAVVRRMCSTCCNISA